MQATQREEKAIKIMLSHSHDELVSVIIPVYNCEKFIARALDSVSFQTYPKIEIIIGDDASDDNSRKIIDNYVTEKKIIISHCNNNIGPGEMRNHLLKQASGEYLAFLDGDDFYHREKIEWQVRKFKQNKSLAAVFCGVARCNETGQILSHSKKYPESDREIRSYIENKQSIPSGGLASVMVKSSCYRKHGGFNAEFQSIGSEDIDWFLRIMQEGEIESVRETGYFYTVNQHSFSRTYSENPLKYNSHRLAFFLYKQRIENNGIDDLSGANSGLYEEFKQRILNDYKNDSTLLDIHIIKSDHLDPLLRLRRSVRALLKKPYQFKFYRYTLRCLRDLITARIIKN